MDKKERLLATAHTMFAKNGYKKTSISDITTKAAMAVGSFYHYFDTKEDIFLAVYIKENERARQHMIETINWSDETDQLVEQFFAYTMDTIRHNNILNEWTNPIIGPMLQQYYVSDAGKNNNSFHQFILKTLQERLAAMGYGAAETKQIISVYELLYAVDCQPAINTLPSYEITIQTLLRYFLKGVSIEKTNGAEK